MRRFFVSLSIITLLLMLAIVILPTSKKKEFSTQRTFTSRIQINRSNRVKQGEPCTIILRERAGRLGNRLFMFASALGLALSHSCSLDVSQPIINELSVAFVLNLTSTINQSHESYNTSGHRIYNHCSHFSVPFLNKSQRIMELTGFWQAHKYFSNYSSEIRRQLRFKQPILDRVHHFFHSYFSYNASTRVGIHIRRGDFLLVRRVSTDQFVFKAMSYFKRKYPSVAFIIVTDDRNYCKKVYGNRTDIFFTPTSFDAPTDLAILTECDHVIMTVGTFGWWGGFLLHDPRGEVLTDAKPDLSPVDANCKGEDYFPPWFSFLNRTKG